jgi:hypothetical protein
MPEVSSTVYGNGTEIQAAKLIICLSAARLAVSERQGATANFRLAGSVTRMRIIASMFVTGGNMGFAQVMSRN